MMAQIISLPGGDLRDAALLIAVQLLSKALPLIETAMLVQAEAQSGLVLVGGSRALRVVRGELDPEALPLKAIGAAEGPRHALLARRLARLASWTPPWRIPRAMLASDTIAVTHNELLQCTARRQAGVVGFRHAHVILSNAANQPAADAPEARALAALLARTLAKVGDLDEVLRKRIGAMITRVAASALQIALRDLVALRSSRLLPRVLWSGTGGHYAARAIGLEVLRRGGEAWRFDHNGETGFISDLELLDIAELSVSSHFVTATDAIAGRLKGMAADGRHRSLRSITFVGGRGNTLFNVVASPPSPGSPRRPRVMYVSSLLLGFFQTVIPFLADPVYLDWQRYLLARLADMPIETIFKPHPDGHVGWVALESRLSGVNLVRAMITGVRPAPPDDG